MDRGWEGQVDVQLRKGLYHHRETYCQQSKTRKRLSEYVDEKKTTKYICCSRRLRGSDGEVEVG